MATTNLPPGADTAAILDTLMYVNEFPEDSTSLEDVLRHQSGIYMTLDKIVVTVIAGYAQNRLTGAIAVTEGMIVFLSEAISKTARVADGFRMAYEFCCTVGAGLKELWDKYHQSQEEKAAQAYLSSATVIRLHTDDLHGLAERLWAVNGRLESLDHRLDNLYKRVKWTDLWNLMRADFKIGWSPKINSCANCLNDTANRFESAEQQILGLMGL